MCEVFLTLDQPEPFSIGKIARANTNADIILAKNTKKNMNPLVLAGQENSTAAPGVRRFTSFSNFRPNRNKKKIAPFVPLFDIPIRIPNKDPTINKKVVKSEPLVEAKPVAHTALKEKRHSKRRSKVQVNFVFVLFSLFSSPWHRKDLFVHLYHCICNILKILFFPC